MAIDDGPLGFEASQPSRGIVSLISYRAHLVPQEQDKLELTPLALWAEPF